VVTSRATIHEREVSVGSGWVALPVVLVLFAVGVTALVHAAATETAVSGVLGITLLTLFTVSLFGFFTLQPNEARVLVLFGDYKGTVREDGFHFGNPFYSNGRGIKAPHGKEAASTTVWNNSRNKISLRSRNLNGERLKVNDK